MKDVRCNTPLRWVLMVLAVLVGALVHPPAVFAAPGLAFIGDVTDIASVNEALKIVFNEPFFENVVADSEFGDAFEEGGDIKYDETTGGRYVENLHELAWPAGVGARLENDYIPQADGAEYENSRVFLKRVMGTVSMTSAVMDRVRSQDGAYLDYMERALPSLQKRVTTERDRMLIGYGYAIKAQVASISAYNTPVAGQFTVVMKNAIGISGYEEPALQFLRGERNVFTASLAAPITLDNAGTDQSARVKNVQVRTNTITYEGSLALHDAINIDDYVGPGDNAGYSFPAGDPAETKEITGMLAAVDDGDIVATYMNIPREGNEYWQGNMIDSQDNGFDGTLTEDLLTFADDENFVIGGGVIDLFLCNRSAERAYWKSLKVDRVLNDPRNYDGGKDKVYIRLNGRQLELKVARKLPPQIAFGLTRDTFKCFRLKEWFWDDKTGAIWNRVVDSVGYKSAYFATGYFWEEFFCGNPQANFRINNLRKVA